MGELTLRAVSDAYTAELHLLTSARSGFYSIYSPRGSSHGGREGPRIFLAYTYPVHYDALVADPPSSNASSFLAKGGNGLDVFDLSLGEIDVGFAFGEEHAA